MRNPRSFLFWLIKNSLILDFKFWKVSKWPVSKKAVFLLKKYYLLFLLQTGMRDFSLGKSFIELFGKKVFFDCRFGLADVLEGARRTLKKTHYLFLEITSEDNDNYTLSELVSLLYRKDSYNYQFRGFRNYLDKGEGKMPIADFLFENIHCLL